MIAWLSVAWAAPSPGSTCDELAQKLAAERLPVRPATPHIWWLEADPCGTAKLGGPVPPEAREVWCVDSSGRRTGPSTSLAGDLAVLKETRFLSDNEVGPRIDWNPATKQAVAWTEYAGDVPHGKIVEWSDAGALVSWAKRGVKDGPSYKIGLRGDVQLIEFWAAGERTSRTCVWRDGKLVIDSR